MGIARILSSFERHETTYISFNDKFGSAKILIINSFGRSRREWVLDIAKIRKNSAI